MTQNQVAMLPSGALPLQLIGGTVSDNALLASFPMQC